MSDNKEINNAWQRGLNVGLQMAAAILDSQRDQGISAIRRAIHGAIENSASSNGSANQDE